MAVGDVIKAGIFLGAIFIAAPKAVEVVQTTMTCEVTGEQIDTVMNQMFTGQSMAGVDREAMKAKVLNAMTKTKDCSNMVATIQKEIIHASLPEEMRGQPGDKTFNSDKEALEYFRGDQY